MIIAILSSHEYVLSDECNTGPLANNHLNPNHTIPNNTNPDPISPAHPTPNCSLHQKFPIVKDKCPFIDCVTESKGISRKDRLDTCPKVDE